MAFDGVVLKTVLNELQILVGARVDHIFQPDKNNIVIGIYNKSNYLLNIDVSANNYRFHLTTNSKTNPLVAPNFCMILRKHLIGLKISKIYMNDLERIAYIEFAGKDNIDDIVVKTLAVELMGKYSNIILLNKDFKVIDALKKFDGDESTRNIYPGVKYSLPSSSKWAITKCNEKDFENRILASNFKTLDSAITNSFTGISKNFIVFAITQSKISNTCSKSNISCIFNFINKIITYDNNNLYALAVKFDNNYSVTFSNTPAPFLQVNFFLDDFYTSKISSEEFLSFRNALLKVLSGILDKINRKLNNINIKINSCSSMDKFKLYGELLNSYAYKFNNINFKKENITILHLENYYDNSMVDIPIKPSKSVTENAQDYFKKYNKLKNTLEVTKLQKIDTEKELDYLESLLYELDACTKIEEVDDVYNEISENFLFNDLSELNKIKTKKNQINPKVKKQDINSLNNYMKFKIDNFDVYVGKNNKQNDYLTKHIAKENDYWFHTKEIHGSHVILKCEGQMPKYSSIEKCAKLAAYYSKAKFSSHVPVDYTLIKNVKKPNGSAPGFVIYTNNRTVYVDPDSGLEYSSC